MIMNRDSFQCEECGKHCEELFALTSYNNQIATGELCEDCFGDITGINNVNSEFLAADQEHQ